MDLLDALNVTVTGRSDAPVMLFLHGYGCGQEMWRHVAPAFDGSHQVVLLDLPGSGGADPDSHDAVRHASLHGYAADVLAVLDRLGADDVTVVGHSVASVIAVLAHVAAPSVVTRLVLVCPSARYVDDGEYRGGFSEADVDDLLELIELNPLGWQEPLSAMVAGGSGTEVGAELEDSFCRTRPDLASHLATLTFRGDNRVDLERVSAPTLVLQVRDDLVAPMSAGAYVHQHVPGSVLRVLETRGHAPHLSAPDQVEVAIADFVGVRAD